MKIVSLWFKYYRTLFLIIQSALVKIMLWCWIGDKLISEPMMVKFKDGYTSLGPNVLKRIGSCSATVSYTSRIIDHNVLDWIIHDSDAMMRARRLKSPACQLFTQPIILAQTRRKHQSSVSLAFVRGIDRWSVNSPHKGPVTRKMFLFDDVIRVENVVHISKQQPVSHALTNEPLQGLILIVRCCGLDAMPAG